MDMHTDASNIISLDAERERRKYIGKRPAVPPGRGRSQEVDEARSGSSSSMRLFGQRGNFSSVSRSQA